MRDKFKLNQAVLLQGVGQLMENVKLQDLGGNLNLFLSFAF